MKTPVSVEGKFLHLLPGLTVVRLGSAEIGIPKIVVEAERVLCTAVGDELAEYVSDINLAANVLLSVTREDAEQTYCPAAEQTVFYLMKECPGLHSNVVWSSQDPRLFSDRSVAPMGCALQGTAQLEQTTRATLAAFDEFGKWRDELSPQPVVA